MNINIENIEFPRSKKVKFSQQKRKIEKKLQQLEKSHRLHNMPSSNNPGKKIKKILARKNFILSSQEEEIPEIPEVIEEEKIDVKNPKTKLCKIRRKPMHRSKPQEPIFYEEDEEIEDNYLNEINLFLQKQNVFWEIQNEFWKETRQRLGEF
jgi:hypothetical protein